MKRCDQGCVIALQFEDGNTKGVILDEKNSRLLFAEAEKPKLAAAQICDYIVGRRLRIKTLSIDVKRKGMAKAVESVIRRIAEAL